MADKNAVQVADEAPPELAATEPVVAEGSAQGDVAADPHPALALVDALEKALEAELPSLTMLMVQASCAEIRKHLQ